MPNWSSTPSFREAWLRAFVNALKQKRHKFTERSKCLTHICIMV
jgi:hypothetical protein